MNQKQNPKPKPKFPSELRFDIVSKDWVVIATGRARRPETFKKEKRKTIEAPQKDCPFCHLDTQAKPTLVFSHGKKIENIKGIPKDWTLVVIPNKFPAVLPGESLKVLIR
jgi:UDPglucose--hexose-1-phosphate uridylyltransferase